MKDNLIEEYCAKSQYETSDDRKQPNDIVVGKSPYYIAVNETKNMIYIVNKDSNSVYVIDGISNRVAAGVKFNIYPANPGKIICNNKEYPTNTYLFADTGTKCTAQSNGDFGFTNWG
jgi:YVTN family beta-propeller protein